MYKLLVLLVILFVATPGMGAPCHIPPPFFLSVASDTNPFAYTCKGTDDPYLNAMGGVKYISGGTGYAIIEKDFPTTHCCNGLGTCGASYNWDLGCTFALHPDNLLTAWGWCPVGVLTSLNGFRTEVNAGSCGDSIGAQYCGGDVLNCCPMSGCGVAPIGQVVPGNLTFSITGDCADVRLIGPDYKNKNHIKIAFAPSKTASRIGSKAYDPPCASAGIPPAPFKWGNQKEFGYSCLNTTVLLQDFGCTAAAEWGDKSVIIARPFTNPSCCNSRRNCPSRNSLNLPPPYYLHEGDNYLKSHGWCPVSTISDKSHSQELDIKDCGTPDATTVALCGGNHCCQYGCNIRRLAYNFTGTINLQNYGDCGQAEVWGPHIDIPRQNTLVVRWT